MEHTTTSTSSNSSSKTGRCKAQAPPQTVSAMRLAAWNSVWTPYHSINRSSPGSGWLDVYWAQQAASCRPYDVAACALKVFLLIGNVRRNVTHDQMFAACWAAGKHYVGMVEARPTGLHVRITLGGLTGVSAVRCCSRLRGPSVASP